MGTIPSPRPYDAGACHALQSAKLATACDFALHVMTAGLPISLNRPVIACGRRYRQERAPLLARHLDWVLLAMEQDEHLIQWTHCNYLGLCDRYARFADIDLSPNIKLGVTSICHVTPGCT
jgi:hypothetical protein